MRFLFFLFFSNFGIQFEIFVNKNNSSLMKTFKLILILLVSSVFFTSCSRDEPLDGSITLGELLSSYDLWYVDIHETMGSGDVPFVSKAFTLSFVNGNMYANNNITDVGFTGNGLGISVGRYDSLGIYLETNHNLDGRYTFDVLQLSLNEIRIYDTQQNVSYLLVGYQREEFDYDMLFYDNIEYFLQEYIAWERTNISTVGTPNPFDEEHFLQFTPINNTTFYSSRDPFGTNVDNLVWDYSGNYEVFDVVGFDNLKILTLNYEFGDFEEFELTVDNDQVVNLFHTSSQTTYEFTGRGFIQILRDGKKANPSAEREDRKRSKIIRKKKKKFKS